MDAKEKYLLHVCCAPCSPHPLRTLREQYEVTLYFYNPNIHPEGEYQNRLGEVRRLAALEALPLIVDDYRPEEWLAGAAPWQDEPEKGRRCEFCIDGRLDATARLAAALGIGRFGAVLSTSSRKDVKMINRLGNKAAAMHNDLLFDAADWKKQEGAKASVRISNQLGFRRQDYCGCIFSKCGAETRRNGRAV
ncbi:MAG: epoxyqueuosine reductase QueH [Nitrospinae bacterium]|nr:epoxyqueuosine reductase QueH [Nitrospinota bacterium]